MNSSVQPPRPAGTCLVGIRLALCLFPGTAVAQQFPAPPRGKPVTRPYLTCVAAPALRFAEPLPPPDLSVRPPAGAPPIPPALAPETAPAIQADALPATSLTSPPPLSPDEPALAAAAQVPVPPTPARILPDDTRPAIRPEDFLPYFIFPGNGQGPGNATVVLPGGLTPPAPGSLPPSSATYRQQ